MVAEHPTYSLNLSLDPIDLDDTALLFKVFGETLNELQAVLSEIERKISAESPKVHWEWEGEPDIRIAASVNGVSAKTLGAIVREARDGFSVASQENQNWSSRVPPATQNRLRKIVYKLSRMAGFTVTATDNEPVKVEKNTEQTQLPRRRTYMEVSELDGILEVLYGRGRPSFEISEHATNNKVRCALPDEFIEKALIAWRKRIIIEGVVRYRQNGTPISVSEITRLEIIPDPDHDIEELRGSIPGITGELSSGEFIQRLRGDHANG